MIPLRIRVRKSAIGSVIDMARSPTRLGHAGDHALGRQLAQAQAADPELAIHRARAPTATTTRMRARLVLGRPLRGDDLGCLGHWVPGRMIGVGRRGCPALMLYAATGSPELRLSYSFGRPSRANGIPSASSSANASRSVCAVVVIATSSPRT